MKPILFNTEMARAILDGRKTVTRRLVKFKAGQNPQWTGYVPDGPVLYGSNNIPAVKAPYHPGDVLYVRETWQYAYDLDGNDRQIEGTGRYLYAADGPAPFNCWVTPEGEYRDTMPWRPSIHMPKEAARIFLRVTDVRAEKLHDIFLDPPGPNNQVVREGCKYGSDFIAVWDNTIKPEDKEAYGWDANPWVWVIEFERISREEAEGGGADA